jgi:hypothetical protein
MINRISCAAIVLTVLSIGFIISGILLIAYSESIIKRAVEKVETIFRNRNSYLNIN